MTEDFDPKVLGGSMKRGIVNPDLAEERKNCDFDQREMTVFLFGQELVNVIDKGNAFIDKNQEMMV